MKFQIVALLALLVAATAGYLRLNYLQDQNTEMQSQIEVMQAVAAHAADLVKKERQAALDADLRRIERQAELEVIENENQKLRDCISAGTCGVRIIRASCPTVPKSPTNSAGTETAAPELDAALQQNILDLRDGIKKLELDFAWCQRELQARQ